jgi:salicylate hydroxylase
MLLEAYQDLRQDRCQFVKDTEMVNAAICTMPPGEARDERNAGMRNSLMEPDQEHMDDSDLLAQWEEIGAMFGYEVHEATEDWWVKFGYLGQNTGVREVLDFRAGITKSQSVYSQ